MFVFKSKIVEFIWDEALLTFTHVINISPIVSLQSDVPNSVWYGKDVYYDHLTVFGCKNFVHMQKDERSKLVRCQDKTVHLHWI